MTALKRRVPLLLLLAALLGLPAGVAGSRAYTQPPGSGLTAGDHTIPLPHGGRRRSYLVHVPKAAGVGVRPVVLAFHGGGGEAAGFKAYAGLDNVADHEGLIVVYPNGTGVLPRRLLTWNAGGVLRLRDEPAGGRRGVCSGSAGRSRAPHVR